MDTIIDTLIEAGYFRAQISSLSDFDKIIGGIAWAMQVFSYDLNIDIFYTDTLDLGQKIALTERLVMVLRVMNCPHQIEPHQIVGLDYANLLPLIKWLVKRSAEAREEHEAFNRLLALRHFNRVTGCFPNRSSWCHVVPVNQLNRLRSTTVDKKQSQPIEMNDATKELARKIREDFKDNKHVSFLRLPSLFVETTELLGRRDATKQDYTDHQDSVESSDDETEGKETTSQVMVEDMLPSSSQRTNTGDINLSKELDTEILATNQKILNLLKKLDSMPSETEIAQYQNRYIELHQQLISKNKDVKKVYALFNSLESTKHYLSKEINLLESIATNLDLTENSTTNRDQFLQQFQEIIVKIKLVKEEVLSRLEIVKRKCDLLNVEYAQLMD